MPDCTKFIMDYIFYQLEIWNDIYSGNKYYRCNNNRPVIFDTNIIYQSISPSNKPYHKDGESNSGIE